MSASVEPTAPAEVAPAERAAPLTCSAALTHHWLVRRRGGEKVLEALGELLPDAPVFTLVHDPKFTAEDWPDVQASFLQRLPGAIRHYPKLLPLMPMAARAMHLPAVDLVLCSDAAIAKAMRVEPGAKLVCYCHSPMRYVWEPRIQREYCASLPWFVRWLAPAAFSRVQTADLEAAARVDRFVANSRHVAERIWKHYGRDSVVVYPPVDLPDSPSVGARDDFLLCVGQHVPYKRLDLAIAASRMTGRRLVVIGRGPDVPADLIEPAADGSVADAQRANEVAARRRDRGLEHVTFLGYQSDESVRRHFQTAAALLFPGEEDFGIVPVEAMAHGCPVVAYGVGGALETVIDGRTGVYFEKQTPDAIAAAIHRAEEMRLDPRDMHAAMQQFSRQRFLEEMREVLLAVLGV